MNPLMNQKYIQDLPQAVFDNLQYQNDFIVETICRRIKEIGTLSATDAHRLSASYYAGADIDKINKEISRITKLNLTEIDKIYENVGKNNLEFTKSSCEFRKMPYIPFKENATMQSMVYAMAKITKGTYTNLSRTAGFISSDGKVLNIRQQYIKAIDRAITSVASGVLDYQSSMRSVIKEMAISGYCTINYESGFSRRLDSAIRQNILTGVKDISQEMQHDIGQAIGADGYEVSYHSNPRPSHVNMGGQQYSRKEFYAEGINDLLQDYNCYHFAFEIIMDINKPNWSEEELAKLKAKDAQTKTWNGKQISGYEATQIQRKLETRIRHLKDEANAYKAAGNDLARGQIQSKINKLKTEYLRFSNAMGLREKDKRMSVAGFRAVKAK